MPGLQNLISGTAGNDSIVGTALDDRILGRSGDDAAAGLSGDDSLDGGLGNDSLYGDSGFDYLIGRQGSDYAEGGTGPDWFWFHGHDTSGADVDTIGDLNFAEGDEIVLGHFDAGTFTPTEIPGELRPVPSEGVLGAGVQIKSWNGLVTVVAESESVKAEKGEGDTLLLKIRHANGDLHETIAIANGWSIYSGLVNAAPASSDDAAAVNEDASVSGNVLTNDSDPDGDVLAVQSVAAAGGSAQAVPASGTVLVVGTYGTISIAADGTYTYSANSAAAQAFAAGVVVQDTFTYTVTDPSGATATAELLIDVTGTNDGPQAQALSGTIQENGPAILFTPNFTDVDAGDTHTTSVNTAGTSGSVTLNADGTFSYDANGKFEALKAGQTATDTFTYTVTDSQGASSTQSVTVTVQGQNDGPSAKPDYNGVSKNSTLTVSKTKGVLANDGDVDGGTLSVSAVNGMAAKVGQAVAGTYGTLTLKADGSYTFVANSKVSTLSDKQVAQDLFTYTVSDGQGGTSTATLAITVADKDQRYKGGSEGCDVLLNLLGDSILDAGNGDDILIGGFCDDGLIGGAGDDWLTGAFGKDTFVFNKGHGDDVIVDFGLGDDTIQFSKAIFQNYAQVLAATTDLGNKLVIDTGGDSITLLFNDSLSDLKASDFIFV